MEYHIVFVYPTTYQKLPTS